VCCLHFGPGVCLSPLVCSVTLFCKWPCLCWHPIGCLPLNQGSILQLGSMPLWPVGGASQHIGVHVEYAAQLPNMWATAMYWSSLPSVLMLRLLAHGIILPLSPPCRPTVGLSSLVGIQFALCGIVTILAMVSCGSCGLGKGWGTDLFHFLPCLRPSGCV